ncbi:DUF6612 family protein [Bacillus badius]|uniref:Lipoprotein n=1 Tax=Bacillus badius TaxID=1455 RepID=A0ABR5AXQ5_BACBA|nr:DUF6612 family protein [Bacillus badius]KIL76044.1 hypothetical protein SD78_0146 [Bacillus badius]KIL79395.1 hypothetical protein SD77_3261 [Bacillus badius]KZN99445.1 hypothetical protein A4244_18025 [Bacillus badius]KZR59679.1 hypothetical protein A3781_11510 [Bacillus badius]MED0668428.1 hypothetical protein [Bacillus badius]
MKKWASWMAAGVLTLGLAACGETAKPTPETPKEETSKMTLGEVFNKTMEVSKETKSLSAAMDMKQKMTYSQEDKSMTTSMKMDMDVTMEPIAVYQKGTMTVAGDGAEQMEPMPVESYMTEQGFYMKEPEGGQWMKLPKEMYDQIMKMSQQQAKPEEQLKQLEQFKDDFKFEQTADSYVLKLDASGEKFNKLIESQMSQMMQGAEAEEAQASLKEMMDAMKIEKVNYTIYVDKKTFETTKMDINMDMAMDIEGNEMKTSQVMNVVYKDYNKVEPIKVPDDVVKNAQEVPMPEME